MREDSQCNTVFGRESVAVSPLRAPESNCIARNERGFCSVTQLGLTFCGPVDCSLPGFSVPEIFIGD